MREPLDRGRRRRWRRTRPSSRCTATGRRSTRPACAEFMAGFARPWWIVGGWAIEAFTGAPREHEDVDLSILACDIPALREHVGDRWHLWSNHGGTLRPLTDKHPEVLDVRSQIWVRASAQRPVGHRPADHPGPGRAVDQQAAAGPRAAARGGDLGRRRRDPLPQPRDRPALQGPAPTGPRTSATSPAPGRCSHPTGGPGCATPYDAWIRSTPGWPGSSELSVAAVGCGPGRAVRLTGHDRLPRPRRHDADAAGGRRGDDRAARPTSATRRSLHASGRHARRVVEESREKIAQALNCRPGEVVFTSGGTESDNLALKGLYWSRRNADAAPDPDPDQRGRAPRRARPAPLARRARGREVELLPVDRAGRLDLAALREAVERDPELGRPDLGDVGQQRGRHAPAGRRRGRRSRPSTASRCTPTPCRPWARCRSTSPPPASTR